MSDRLTADGFDAAIVGVGRQGPSNELTVYSYGKCIELLKNDGMTEEDAIDHFEFNIVGGWVGPSTPVFLMPEDYCGSCD